MMLTMFKVDDQVRNKGSLKRNPQAPVWTVRGHDGRGRPIVWNAKYGERVLSRPENYRLVEPDRRELE